MHKVGDTVFRANGKGYDKGVVVRIARNKCLVNFGSFTSIVNGNALHTQRGIRNRSVVAK